MQYQNISTLHKSPVLIEFGSKYTKLYCSSVLYFELVCTLSYQLNDVRIVHCTSHNCNTIFKLQNTIQYLVSQYGRNYGENLKQSLVQFKLVVSMAYTLELGHWPKPRLGRSAAVQQTYVAASISTGLYLVP